MVGALHMHFTNLRMHFTDMIAPFQLSVSSNPLQMSLAPEISALVKRTYE